MTVIDGVSNNSTTVNTGFYPRGVAVNPVTNRIYVANQCGNDLACNSGGTVTVIDGATNNTQTVRVGVSPYAIAVDKVTNKIYVGNVGCVGGYPCPNPGTVTVIDGATNSTHHGQGWVLSAFGGRKRGDQQDLCREMWGSQLFLRAPTRER